MDSSAGSRGQSEVVGFVLLLILVAGGAATVLLAGSHAMTLLRDSVSVQDASHGMRQADARISRVAFSKSNSETINLGANADQTVDVKNDSWVRIRLNHDSSSCGVKIRMGRVIEHTDGGDVAYEGGGVWKNTSSGAAMVSPPDFQYVNGTLNFPVVGVNGRVSGTGNDLHVSQDPTATQALKTEVQKLSQPKCQNPDNLTVMVHSVYYRAWGRYLEQRVANNLTYYDSNQTVAVTLQRIKQNNVFAVDNSTQNAVNVKRNFTATAQVLGTELSGMTYARPYGYWRPAVIYSPITFNITEGSKTLTPWPSNPGPSGASYGLRYNLNNPDRKEKWSYTFTGKPGTNVSVEATSWYSSNYVLANNETITRNGQTYYQYKPQYASGKWISINSHDKSDQNLVLLSNGQKVPAFGAASSFQRSLKDILGNRIDNQGVLHIQDNQVVFVYELSKANADPKNANAQSDPDYNDAVVLLTIQHATKAEASFHIHVSATQVRIT